MKKILYLLLSILIFIPFNLVGQTNWASGGLFEEQSQTENVSCTRISDAYNNIYKHKESYIPSTNNVSKYIPIKTVKISIHVIQKDDGTGNWQNVSADRNFLEQVVNDVSLIYSDNTTPSDPILNTDDEILDSRVRIVLDEIHYYQSTYYHTNTSPGILRSYVNNNYPDRLSDGINYFLTEGAASYAGSTDKISIVTYKTYSGQNIHTPYAWPKHLSHEIGHIFDVNHTYNEGVGGGQAICDPNHIDYLTDVYLSTSDCPHDGGWGCDLTSANYSCTNNLMGGSASSGYISPMQAGIINRTLTIGYASRFVDVDCYSSIPKEITSNETWDFPIRLYQDLIIKAGATLTVQCTLRMAPLAKIIVEPGAELIIDGGLVTTPIASTKYWQGVEVWGNYNLRQLPENQGRVQVINDGTIMNAVRGISAIRTDVYGNYDWSKTGGIVYLNNANLINNNFDVWIGGYHNFVTIGGQEREWGNLSRILNSHFENNDDMFSEYEGFAFIGLWDVGRVSIYGNNFINLKTGQTTQQKGRGIVAINSTISVRDYCPSSNILTLSEAQESSAFPCTDAVKNYFEGLYYGIEANSATGFNNSIIQVDRAEFNNVYHGIHILNTNYADITNCSFEIANNDPAAITDLTLTDSYGIYLDGSDGYRIEENSFTKDASQLSIRGIIVNESGSANNELYKNYLNELDYAIQAQGNNRGARKGLGIYCNEMNDDGYDIVVLDVGIAKNQRIWTNDLQDPISAAGNVFSLCGSSIDENYYNASLNNIIYYPDMNNIPQCTYGITISQNSFIPLQCPTKLGSTMNSVIISKNNSLLAWNSAKTILEIWQDGGNANLENEVETTLPWDVYVKFNELIAESPYLSDEVLLATIENSAFTSLMIKLLMVANTHAAHNEEIMQAIYDRIPLMPETYINEILEGGENVSQLEILEANVTACEHAYNKLSNDVKRIYQMEYEEGGDINTYINFLDSLNTLESEYELASLYLTNNDTTSLNSVLASIESDYTLSDQQLSDYVNWNAYFNIVKDVKKASFTIGVLTENQKMDLEIIAENENSPAAYPALSLLILNDPNYPYYEIVKPVIIDSLKKASVNIESDIYIESDVFKVYPNPSYDFITLEYQTGDRYNLLRIIIIDETGKTVLAQNLQGGNNEELINLNKLNSGIYTLFLLGNNEVIESRKITIMK